MKPRSPHPTDIATAPLTTSQRRLRGSAACADFGVKRVIKGNGSTGPSAAKRRIGGVRHRRVGGRAPVGEQTAQLAHLVRSGGGEIVTFPDVLPEVEELYTVVLEVFDELPVPRADRGRGRAPPA